MPELLALVSVRVTGGSTLCPGVAPGAGVPGGACASTTTGDMTATMTARSTITANAVRLQDGNVLGLLSIHMMHIG